MRPLLESSGRFCPRLQGLAVDPDGSRLAIADTAADWNSSWTTMTVGYLGCQGDRGALGPHKQSP